MAAPRQRPRKATPARGPSHYDVQLAQVVDDGMSRRLKMKLVSTPFIILAFAAPLALVYAMVTSLAGKNTTLDFKVVASVTITITLSLAGIAGGAALKIRRQSKELTRLRARSNRLETMLHNQGVLLPRDLP